MHWRIPAIVWNSCCMIVGQKAGDLRNASLRSPSKPSMLPSYGVTGKWGDGATGHEREQQLVMGLPGIVLLLYTVYLPGTIVYSRRAFCRTLQVVSEHEYRGMRSFKLSTQTASQSNWLWVCAFFFKQENSRASVSLLSTGHGECWRRGL